MVGYTRRKNRLRMSVFWAWFFSQYSHSSAGYVWPLFLGFFLTGIDLLVVSKLSRDRDYLKADLH